MGRVPDLAACAVPVTLSISPQIQDTNSTTSNDEFTKKLSELTLADPTEVKEEPTKQVDQVKQVKQKDGKKEDKQRVGA